jgi:hypothetical protein
MTKLAVVAFVSLVGCGKGGEQGAATRETETHEFAGIRLSAPKGSTYKLDYETTAEPQLTVTGPHLRVMIIKTIMKMSMAAYKETTESLPGVTNVTGTATARGWELIWNSDVTAGAKKLTARMEYVDLSQTEHYECTFDDEESDVATADALCKSIALK